MPGVYCRGLYPGDLYLGIISGDLYLGDLYPGEYIRGLIFSGLYQVFLQNNHKNKFKDSTCFVAERACGGAHLLQINDNLFHKLLYFL